MKIKTLVSVHVRGEPKEKGQLGEVIVLKPGVHDLPTKISKHLLNTKQALKVTGNDESPSGPSVTTDSAVNITNPPAGTNAAGNGEESK